MEFGETKMKKRHFIKNVVPLLFGSLLVATFLAGCCCINIGGCSGKEKYERTENLSAPIAAEAILDVETDVGSIAVTGADVTDCNVTATICVKAPSKQQAQEIAEQVEIKLETLGNTLILKAEKPAKKCKRSITVSFEITVPQQTALQLESDVGKIRVSNTAGQIKAKTNVGKIICKEISGDIVLKTNVGKVKVEYAETAPPAVNADIVTNIGDIKFTAPAGLSATVYAATNIGSVQTTLPLTVTGTLGKHTTGTIGTGEGKLHLKTNIGSIKIR